MKALIFGLILSLFSCALTPYKQGSTEDPYFRELNKKLERKRVLIALSDGTPFEVLRVVVERDSTTWTRRFSGKKETVATHKIKNLSIRTGRSGNGVIAGAILGVVIGYTLTTSSLNDRCSDRLGFCKPQNMFPIVGGLAGGLVGAFVGGGTAAITSQEWQPVLDFTAKGKL